MRQLPVLGGHPQELGGTLRSDAWWIGPTITVAVFSSFIAYTTWAIFQANHYYAAPYLSPLYSPLIFVKEGVAGGAPLKDAWLGAWPAWWPVFALMPMSPALLILPFPGLFRFTCYYYRKAYYRSFAMTPPACAVGARSPGSYNGERKLLVFQNLHRFALYFALLFLVFLWHDFYDALWFDGKLGLGVGSLVLLGNVTFLSLYTFSCHSFRHLVGGSIDSYSETPLGMLRHRIWGWVSKLNLNHMAFAWISLLGVMFCDFYVRMVAAGAITDIRLF